MKSSSWVNNVHCEGYVFNHTLSNRTSQKTGTPFIMGDLNIATDEDATNVVTVHFTYVTETYSKSGKPNATYAVLQSIIDDNNTYENNGKDATKVRVDGQIEVNDFYTRDGELASPKRIRGSFVHTMNAGQSFAKRPATFEAEIVIAGCSEKEVEDGDDYVELRGYVFDYRNSVLPVTFNTRSDGGKKYFLDQDISSNNPLVTKVWGDIVSMIVKTEKTVESAFGEPTVDVTTRTVRSWNVIGASAEPMEWDDESTITKDELKQALADREVYLAEVKQRQDEYNASRNGNKSSFTTSTSTSVDDDDDDFAF